MKDLLLVCVILETRHHFFLGLDGVRQPHVHAYIACQGQAHGAFKYKMKISGFLAENSTSTQKINIQKSYAR
jgi:hypothetical protein